MGYVARFWLFLLLAALGSACGDDAGSSQGPTCADTIGQTCSDCPWGATGVVECAADGPFCQCNSGFGGTGGSGAISGFGGTGGFGGVGGFGGSGGVGGNAGNAGTGGAAGMAGLGGSGGTAGTGGVGGVGGSGGSGGTSGSGGSGGSGGCFQGSGDYTAMGPYPTMMTDVTLGGLGTYTIFRPANLDPNCKHPIVSWGNGTGVTGSNIYAFYQTHAASWGMVVIASHSDQAASMPFIAGGIDHLLAENNNASSPLHNALSTKAGTAGHSQGGMAATSATSHPNVDAEVCVQGGGTPRAGVAVMCLTGTEDFLRSSCTGTYNGATGPGFLGVYQGADHNTTPTLGGYFQRNPGSLQYQRLYTAWFRCHLADDENACAMFRGGANCGICSEPNWAEIKGKNF